MKKIFAIALALVMVLSMASAFAFCKTGDYAWDCATTVCNFGKAKVEVVPFVRSTTACAGESTFVQSDCAAAVPKENIYYAVKLTVDSDINEDWYNAITLKIKGTNLSTNFEDTITKPVWKKTDGTEVASNGGVFWLYKDGATDATDVTVCTGWEEEGTTFTFGDKNIFKAVAAKTSAKVCVTLTSEHKVTTSFGDLFVNVSDWSVDYNATDKYLCFDFGGANGHDKCVVVYLDADSKVYKVTYATNTSSTDEDYTFVARNADGLVKENGGTMGTDCAPGSYVAKVLDYFGLGFGTCVTEKAINANFGWKDEVQSCTSYKTQGTAVVDAECVVAIPKTGDKGLLWWLF